MNNGSDSNSFKTAMFADCLANSKEIFQLMDQVFPLDSCRHYEVLPLKLNGSHLVLGMLDPAREESLRFAQSIAKVFKYDLEVQLIDLQTYEIILANYPQNETKLDRSQQDRNQTVIDTSFNPNAPLQGINSHPVDSAPTIISHHEPSSSSQHELSDLPADLDFLRDLELTPKAKPTPARPKPDSSPTLFETPPEFINQKSAASLDDRATIVGNPADLLAQSMVEQESEIAMDEAELAISQLIDETLAEWPSKTIEAESIDFLPLLSNQLSWSKLLEKAFEHQSDYLKLTCYSDRGTIIARKDRINQSTLDSVPLAIFGSLLDDIKRMSKLPPNTSSHPKKLVVEKLYQEERILLRLEFSVQQSSQEVRIQILRAQALRSYEQQQMDRVSDHALQLAKQLEKTLRRIQACFDSAELNNLVELQTIHSRITHQLRLLDQKH